MEEGLDSISDRAQLLCCFRIKGFGSEMGIWNDRDMEDFRRWTIYLFPFPLTLGIKLKCVGSNNLLASVDNLESLKASEKKWCESVP